MAKFIDESCAQWRLENTNKPSDCVVYRDDSLNKLFFKFSVFGKLICVIASTLAVCAHAPMQREHDIEMNNVVSVL